MTLALLLAEVEAFGIELSIRADKLHVEAPMGVLTAELLTALKEHKAEIITLLSTARPGKELEQLHREIGELVRAEEAQWELSTELDPAWPPSAGVRNRIRRKEAVL